MECRKLLELQGRSQSHRSRVALMFKASESNLDRTALLMANNPLPDLHSHQEGDSPTKYLASDILAQQKVNSPPHIQFTLDNKTEIP